MFDISTVLGGAVSDLDTTTERMISVDIDKLVSDERNFYSLDGIDELASNIAFCGLQQPIRVRANGDGSFTIVSGHRRTAALRKLVEEGEDRFRHVPCIVDSSTGSEALQELRLIYANADTRRMNSADISKQAERVEMLLYQLKEEGVEFPGRMRDHVAAACKISASKLARLKVIREKLKVFEAKKLWESGGMSEAVAYALAKKSVARQAKIVRHFTARGSKLSWISEWKIKEIDNNIEKVNARKCSKGGELCSHGDVILDRVCAHANYDSCEQHCCKDCGQLAHCKDACPKLHDKIAKIKAAEKDAKRAKAETEKAQQQIDADQVAEIWTAFGAALAESGKSFAEYRDGIEMREYWYSDKDWQAYSSGEKKHGAHDYLPFGFGVRLDEVRTLIRAADVLGCSVDKLLGREPAGTSPRNNAGAPQWRTVFRDEPEDGQLVILRDSGDLYSQPARYIDGRYYMDPFSVVPEMDIEVSSTMRWLPVPEPPMEDDDE